MSLRLLTPSTLSTIFKKSAAVALFVSCSMTSVFSYAAPASVGSSSGIVSKNSGGPGGIVVEKPPVIPPEHLEVDLIMHSKNVHGQPDVIKLELFAKKAPITVKNFLAYVRSGYFNKTIFHRIIQGFVIQGGAYDTNFVQKPSSREPIENESTLCFKDPKQKPCLKNAVWTISMARTADPNSATSQFFINLTDNTDLDATEGQPGYAVFGKVIAGQDVIERIAKLPIEQREDLDNVPKHPKDALVDQVVIIH